MKATDAAINFIKIIADFKKDGEDDHNYIEDDDALATLEWIIDEAREILGRG